MLPSEIVDAARRLGSSQFRRNTNSKHLGKRNRSIGHWVAVDGTFQGNLIKPSLMNLNTRVSSEARRKYVGHGSIIIPLLKLDNRDRITLLVSNINVKSKIVPNCFDDPEDVEMMIAGIRTTISVARTKAMWTFASRLSSDTRPESKNHEYDSSPLLQEHSKGEKILYHISDICEKRPMRVNPRLVNLKKIEDVFAERLEYLRRIQAYDANVYITFRKLLGNNK